MKAKQPLIKCPYCGIKMNHREQEIGMCDDCEQEDLSIDNDDYSFGDDFYDDEY